METKKNILIVLGLVCICSNFILPLAESKAAEGQYVGQRRLNRARWGKKFSLIKNLQGQGLSPFHPRR